MICRLATLPTTPSPTRSWTKYIESRWGSAEDFMLVYGLRFYKDEDCEEAKAIVARLMDS